MGKGKQPRAAGGRRERHQLPPLGLGASRDRRPYYAALVDVHEDQSANPPWSAVIEGDKSERQRIPTRTITGATVAELWHDVHDELQEIGDGVENIVGTKWMLDGDGVAWMELHDREQLDDVPIGVPGGLPTYRARMGGDQ
jgi:hypothetical protein